MSTFAGDGTPAQLETPYGIAVGTDGNFYVSDLGNNYIRKISPSGSVSTFAGDGTPAQFETPYGIAVGPDGNVFAIDSSHNRVRRISPSGKVSTIIKDLDSPQDIALTSDGATGYIVDSHRIIRVRFR